MGYFYAVYFLSNLYIGVVVNVVFVYVRLRTLRTLTAFILKIFHGRLRRTGVGTQLCSEAIIGVVLGGFDRVLRRFNGCMGIFDSR